MPATHPSAEPPEDVVALARRQHGVVSTRQLRDAGVTRSKLRTKVRRGDWSRMLQGIYRVGAAEATWEAQLQAHLLAAGEEAVASHQAAAALHGLEGFHRARLEISVPRNCSYNHEGVLVHRSTDLQLVSSATRKGLPVTPVVRTLLDLAAVVPQPRLHRAIEDARRRDLVSWTGLTRSLVAHARPGRLGITALRSIVDEHQDEVLATENGFEFLVMSLLKENGLPEPVPQYEVCLDGDRYRVDLAYPWCKLAIELDGSKHIERSTFETDRPRQNALVLAGWTVLRYTWRFYVRSSAGIVRDVRTALGLAGS
jgi:hypothetical protein